MSPEAKVRKSPSRGGWLESGHHRASAGVIRQQPGMAYAPGAVAALPTATESQFGSFRVTTEGVYACQFDGAAYQWVLIQQPFDPGEVLIDTESFSGVAAVSLDGIFTADYRDYRIVLNVTDLTLDADLSVRYRTAAVDDTNATYSWSLHYGWTDTNAYALDQQGDTNWDLTGGGIESDRNTIWATMEISAPQLAVRTIATADVIFWESTTVVDRFDGGCVFNNTTQFDGIKFTLSAGAMTGDLKVYAYADTPGSAATPTFYQPLDASLTSLAALDDPGADKIVFWDDSAGAFAFLEPAANLAITNTDLDATGGGGTSSLADILMLGGM